MKKKLLLLSYVITIALVICLMPIMAQTFYNEEGTEVSPYKIDNASDLQELANDVNAGNTYAGKYFLVTADLDMSSVCGSNLNGIDSSWTPIGNGENVFEGTLNGDNHVISNLYISTIGNTYYGLFGTNKGTIRNIGIDINYNLNGKIVFGAIGGLCGFNLGTITHCFTSGNIVSDLHVEGSIGGLCGINSGIIKNCYNTACALGNYQWIGGLCGVNKNSITNCYNTGNISCKLDASGICGTNMGNISQCYNIGKIYGAFYQGNICARDKSKLTNKCYYDKQQCTIEGINSIFVEKSAEGKTTSELTSGSFFNDAENWIEKKGMYPRLKGIENSDVAVVNALPVYLSGDETFANVSNKFSVGTMAGVTWTANPSQSLSIDNTFGDINILSKKMETITLSVSRKGVVYKTIQLFLNYNKELTIDSVGDLIDFCKGVNSCKTFSYKEVQVQAGGKHATFKLTKDLNLSSVCGKDINGKDCSWTTIGIRREKDWNGIAIFEGTFDGGNHVISDLYINVENYSSNGINNRSQGLFGYNKGIIENLGIINSNVKGKDNVGCICGINIGIIRNCHNAGNVTGYKVGGICGVQENGTIIDCYNSGNINGESSVGGLCGAGGNLSNSYNTGNIIGSAGSSVGGICGIGKDICNCYNTGNTSGGTNSYIGGICGDGYNIQSCYNAGNVGGNFHFDKDFYRSAVGGICGVFSNSINNCYNIGNVIGYENIGGICGQDVSKNGIMSKCYNIGNIKGENNIGEICGSPNKKETVINYCYYNKDKYTIGGIEEMNAIEKFEGKTSFELQSGTLFNDPENWIEEKGKYPQLKNVGIQK